MGFGEAFPSFTTTSSVFFYFSCFRVQCLIGCLGGEWAALPPLTDRAVMIR